MRLALFSLFLALATPAWAHPRTQPLALPPSAGAILHEARDVPRCGDDLHDIDRDDLEQCARSLIHRMAGDDLVAFFGFQPSIVIRDNPAPLAIAHAPRRVVVTTGITRIATTPDALAFVIAHELGHLELQHGRHRNLLGPAKAEGALIRERVLSLVDSELAADTYAHALITEAGLNPTAGVRVLATLRGMAREQGLLHEPLYIGIGGRISHLAALQNDARLSVGSLRPPEVIP